MSKLIHPLLKKIKVGFVGAGNMTQALIKGLLESEIIKPEQISVSNRTPGKLLKLKDLYNIETFNLNEPIVEECDVVVLAMKPQDFPKAVEDISQHFRKEQIIISLAAGISMDQLEKLIPEGRIIRVMPNTPALIGRGVIGMYSQTTEESAVDIVQDLLSSLGYVLKVETEDQFDALMISCSSGTGFVFELMMYWQDWIQERGFTTEEAKQMTIETFLGASMLAAQSVGVDLEKLQQRVTSRKGVTAAGLDSMRELEIERALRISFEKSSMRSKEISKQSTN